MADPTPYGQDYNFSGFQTSNPSSPLPGTRVDIELSAVRASTVSIVNAIKDIRRSDGKLKNNSVGPDALSAALVLGFTLHGGWVDGTSYQAGDGVTFDSTFYKARVQHVATAETRPDLDATTWAFLFTFESVAIGDGTIQPVQLDASQAAGFLQVLGIDDQGALIATAIAAATNKSAPANDDLLGLSDSDASGAFKGLSWANLKAGVFGAFGALIAGGSVKAAPADGDQLVLSDSEAAGATKVLGWADLKTALSTYFKGLGGLAVISGDILYGSGANTLARRPKGANGKILGMAANLPDWVDAPFKGYGTGLGLSNSVVDATNDIVVAAGAVGDTTGVGLITLATALTKRLDAAWAAGSDQGGLSTGTIANGSYHVHAVKNPTTGVSDVILDVSPTAPTLPSGFTLFCRIGSIIRAGGSIQPFVQDGDDFFYNTAPGSLTADYSGGSRSKAVLSVNVPTGIRVTAKFQLNNFSVGGGADMIATLSDGAFPNVGKVSEMRFAGSGTISTQTNTEQKTNTSAQIQLQVTGSSITCGVTTLGWADTRWRAQ